MMTERLQAGYIIQPKPVYDVHWKAPLNVLVYAVQYPSMPCRFCIACVLFLYT